MRLPAVPTDADVPGVYFADDTGTAQLVHEYQGGEYSLDDIVLNFQLGELVESGGEGETVLLLTRDDLRTLKWMAAAYSFDYEAPFIEMCLEMKRFADQFGSGPASTEMRFTANF